MVHTYRQNARRTTRSEVAEPTPRSRTAEAKKTGQEASTETGTGDPVESTG
jgi:hypothetical protein